MRGFVKKSSVWVVVVVTLCLLVGTIPAEAATKWVFSTSNGKKKVAAKGETVFVKGEYQDMNIYKNGKQIKNDATYSVKWYSSDPKVIYADKKSGKLRADKYGKMSGEVASAKITVVVKNNKNGGMVKKSFTAVVTDVKAELTATPTPIPVKYSKVNALMVELPDCTNISSGDVWIESEVNIQLQCAASQLPEQGILTAEFAYQDNANVAANKPQVELFIGNIWETFGSGQGSQVKTKDGKWSIFSKSVSYELSGETCVITIKTHSGSGEASIPFAIANLIFEDSQTGEKRRLDLQSSALEWQCKRYATGEQIESEWVVLQIPSEKVIPTFAPLPTATPIADESILENTGVVIALPDDTGRVWTDAWNESKTKIQMKYFSAEGLKRGRVTLKLCYPKTVSFDERDEQIEVFQSLDSSRIIDLSCKERKSLNDKWNYIEIEYEYEGNESEFLVELITHSASGSKATLLGIADVVITDSDSGKKHYVDLTKKNVEITCEKVNPFADNNLQKCAYRIFETKENTVLYEFGDVEKELPEASRITPVPVVEGERLEHTGVVVALPDDSENIWTNEWEESKAKIRLKYTSESFLSRCKISLKLCYPKMMSLDERNETIEVLTDDKWSNILIRLSDKERKSLNNKWSYVEIEYEYDVYSNVLPIRIITHSVSGSKGILFGIADIVITDLNSNETQYVDLTKGNVAIEYSKGNSLTEGYSYRISEMKENRILYEFGNVEKELPERAYEPDSNLYCLTYKLPEATEPWSYAWEDSEANMIIKYLSETPLSSGTIKATLCVPKEIATDREDVFELAVHSPTDFMNFSSDQVRVSYLGDQVSADNHQIYEEDDYYKIELAVDYDGSKVDDENIISIYFKSHCEISTHSYEVTLCNVCVEDDSAGSVVLDFSSENVDVSGKMYRTGKSVAFTLSDSVFDFYLVNTVGKIAKDVSYALKVYNRDGSPIVYKSSDSSVASVDTKGIITTHKVGNCEITVTKTNTGESKSFMFSVVDPKVTLTQGESFMLIGSETKFEAITEYGKYGGQYTFRSTNASVASVDSDGLVKAKKAGTTTIIVTDTANNGSGSFELMVYEPEDKDGIAKYLSIEKTHYVTPDIAKRSYEILYDVYKNVFDYFNYGEYEEVTLHFTVKDYSPAYSNSVDVFLSSEHMLSNSKDVDCITHELIHCAQNYDSVGEYVWLMEGLTDYGRYLFGLHNADCGWSLSTYNPSQHYTNSYTVTAAFLKFVTENYCKDLPHIINKMFKEPAGYDESIWVKNTGYTIDELWALYAKS